MNEHQDKLKAVFADYKTLVVTGANWGDEGKGKVIDLVMENYDVVTRFSGGSNAGHTVFTPQGKKVVSHLIPCGLAQNKPCVLARGEFFNLELFVKELEQTRETLGGDLAPIYIDLQAPLWTPYHALLEFYIESVRGNAKIGTTNKGIGPLEGLYKLRLAPLVGYLFEPDILKYCLQTLHKALLPSLRALADQEIPESEKVVEQLLGQAEQIKQFVCDTSYYLQSQLTAGKRILFEGAQATGLDAWWGTYPFVSSGNSTAAGAALGTGLAPADIAAGILVAKTLPTRVGNGPFPSEMWERQAAMEFAKEHLELFSKGQARDKFLSEMLEKINSGQATPAEMSQYFQVLGDERGATTGRGRSVGFLDIPWLHYAIRVNKPNWLALTRFDMLSGIKTVPVVTGYKLDGKLLAPGQLPPPWHLPRVETVIENWPGFNENIFGINKVGNLPGTAREFLFRLEKLLGISVLMVGTGPGREAMVITKD